MSKKIKIKITKKAWLNQTVEDRKIEAKRRRWASEKKASHLDKSGKDIFNEVSFNVLENAAEKSKKDKHDANAGYKHRTVMSSDEMLYNKSNGFKIKKAKTHKHKDKEPKQPKKSFKTKILVSVLCAVVLFACIGTMYYAGMFGEIQEISASKILINDIASNDNVIIRLDHFLTQNLDENDLEDYLLDEQDLTNAISKLEGCRENAEQILSETEVGSDEYNACTNAVSSIDARLTMLECGTYIYKNYVQTANYIKSSDEMWNLLLDAEELLRTSDELASKNNESDLNNALNLCVEAVDKISSAKTHLESLSSSNLKFDFTNYASYINTRLASAQASRDSIAALLNQDTDTAIAKNDAYVALENDAADLAETINTNPSAIIRTNYDIDIKPYIDKYKEARNAAATSDSLIRNYYKI